MVEDPVEDGNRTTLVHLANTPQIYPSNSGNPKFLVSCAVAF